MNVMWWQMGLMVIVHLQASKVEIVWTVSWFVCSFSAPYWIIIIISFPRQIVNLPKEDDCSTQLFAKLLFATSELCKKPGNSDVDNASRDCFWGRAFCLRPPKQSHDPLSTSLLPDFLRNSEMANIYGTLTPSHKSGKKWGKVSGPYAVCRSACIVYTYVTCNIIL